MFPDTPAGSQSAPQSATLTNISNLPVGLSSVTSSSAVFPMDSSGTNNCSFQLAPGASCTVTYKFKPSLAGTYDAETLDVASGSSVFRFPLFGIATGPTLTPQPASLSEVAALDISQVTTPSGLSASSYAIDHSQSLPYHKIVKTLTITNTGPIPATGLAIANTADVLNDGPPGVTHDCPTTLAPNASCTITVQVYKHIAGVYRSTLSVSSSNTKTTRIPLSFRVSSTAIAPTLYSTTSSINLGTLVRKTPSNVATTTFQLSSTEPAAQGTVTLNNTPSAFTIVNNGCLNQVLTVSNNTCSISFTYTPPSLGPTIAVLPASGQILAPTASATPPFSIPTTISANVIGEILALTPSSINLGRVPTNSTTTIPATVRNSGTLASPVSTTTAIPGLAINSTSCPPSLNPGSTCPVTLTYTPATPASINSSISLVGNTSTTEVPFAAEPTSGPILQVSTPIVPFGEVAKDAFVSPLSVILSNIGASSADISALATAAPFILTTSCDPALPLPPSSSCTLSYDLDTSYVGAFSIPSIAGTGSYAKTITASATIAAAQSNSQINLVFSPVSAAFLYTPIGQESQPQSILVRNTGTDDIIAPVLLDGAAPSEFSVLPSSTCTFPAPHTFEAGKSCVLNVVYKPTDPTLTAPSATLHTASSKTTTTLSASAIATSTITYPNIPFDTTNPSNNYTLQKYYFKNPTSGTINATPALAINQRFAIEASTCTASLPVNTSCVITLKAKSDTLGSFSDQLNIGNIPVSVNATVIPAPILSFNTAALSLESASLKVPHSYAPKATLTNTGNGDANLSTVSFINRFGTAYTSTCPATLTPGQSCDFSFSAKPSLTTEPLAIDNPWTTNLSLQTADGLAWALLPVSSSVMVPTFAASPSPLAFGDVYYGQSKTVTLSLTNTSTNSAQLLLKSITPPSSDFTIDPNSPCLLNTTPAGNTCALSITFAPSKPYTSPSMATLSHNALKSSLSEIPFTARALQSFNVAEALSPQQWSPSTYAGTPIAQTFSFTNSYYLPLTLGNLSSSANQNSNRILFSNDTCSQQTIASGNSCSFTATYNTAAPYTDTNKAITLPITTLAATATVDIPAMSSIPYDATLSNITDSTYGSLQTTAGRTVTLTGTNFYADTAWSQTNINNVPAATAGWTRSYSSLTSQTLKVPANATPGTYAISVANWGQTIPSTLMLTVYPSGPQITPSVAAGTTIGFGTASTQAKTVTLTNTGGMPATISASTIAPYGSKPASGSNGSLALADSCAGTLNPAQSCNLTVTFTAGTSGTEQTAKLTTPLGNGLNTLNFPLDAFSGNMALEYFAVSGYDTTAGTTAADYTTSAINMGPVSPSGSSVTVTVKNTGALTATTVYPELDSSGSNLFSITGGTCGTALAPLASLAVNSTCTIIVKFAAFNPDQSLLSTNLILRGGFPQTGMSLPISAINGQSTSAGISTSGILVYNPFHLASGTSPGTTLVNTSGTSLTWAGVGTSNVDKYANTMRPFNPTVTAAGGTVYDWNGNGGYYSTTTPFSGSGDFTFGIWTLGYSSNVNTTFYTQATNSTDPSATSKKGNFAIYADTSGHVCYRQATGYSNLINNTGDASNVCSTSTIPSTSGGGFRFVTVSRSNGVISVSFNANTEATATPPLLYMSSNAGSSIGIAGDISSGSWVQATRTGAGLAESTSVMADMFLFQRALTPAEIQQVYSRRAPLLPW